MKVVYPNTCVFYPRIIFGKIKIERLVKHFGQNLVGREHEGCRLASQQCVPGSEFLMSSAESNSVAGCIKSVSIEEGIQGFP